MKHSLTVSLFGYISWGRGWGVSWSRSPRSRYCGCWTKNPSDESPRPQPLHYPSNINKLCSTKLYSLDWIGFWIPFQPLGCTGQYLCLHQVLKFGYGQINTKSSSIVQLTLRQTRQGEEGRGILERAVWVKGRLCMAASIKHCGDRERLLHMIRLDTFDCLGPIQLTIIVY